MQELANSVGFNDFELSLVNRPTEVLGCLGIALSIAIAEELQASHPSPPTDQPIPPLFPRLVNLSSQLNFGELKSGKNGQLVSITGYVVKVSNIRPLVESAMFLCPKCMNMQSWKLDDGVFNPPPVCNTSQ